MTMLIAGLAVFFSAHLMLSIWPGRAALAARLGEGGRKGAVAVLSLAGFALLATGYQNAGFTPVYDPIQGARSAAHAVMPFAFILLAGSQLPSNVKRYVRHPMALAVIAWAAVHLAANGDLASVILFGSFGLYALYDLLRPRPGRGADGPPPRPPLYDVAVVAVGLVGYGAAIWAHRAIFGVAVTG